jgi:hypothetical protein
MIQENTPNTDAEISAELAKPEDISEFVAEREEQIADEAPPEDPEGRAVKELREKYPELKEAKKASRYERLKRARDQFKSENEQYRSKYGPLEASSETHSETQASERQSSTPDTAPIERSLEAARHIHGERFDAAYTAFIEHVARTHDQAAYQQVMSSPDVGEALVEWHNGAGNPSPSPEAYEAAMQQGRQQQEFEQALAQRDAEIRTQAELNLRVEAFAEKTPDFYQTIKDFDEVFGETVPPLATDLIKRSPLGPEIAYLIAKDAFNFENSYGIADQMAAIANDPVSQARMVGALEQVIYAQRKGQSMPMQRATKAPPPLTPVRGGANAPRDIHSLAKNDNVEDYIAARRRSG